MKTLIEIHVLQNFAPSNLNRDDTGAPKDALFGGSHRARISSQCLKRAVRMYFRELVADQRWSPEDVALRTKRILAELVGRLVNAGRDPREAEQKTVEALSAIKLSIADEKSQYLLFLGQQEIDRLAKVIDSRWEMIQLPKKAVEGEKPKSKKKTAQNADPELKKAMDAVLDGGKAVDVALFGRMLADMPEKNQNAACQVAHALSTHAVQGEFDFYTAVDDCKPEDTAGADMIGTVEFNSACYYRYAVVDWQQLVNNLGSDEALARKGLRAFLEGFVVAEPTGKQNTFAAHNPPGLVAVSVRRNTAPRSLTNAFESAIQARTGEHLTSKSATALTQKATDLQAAYGGEGETFVLNLTQADTDALGESVTSLDTLLERALAALRG